MIPGKEAVIQKLGEALQKTKTSIEVVTSGKRFSPAIVKFKDAYTNALERGVRIRVATEKPVAEKAVCEIVERLMDNGRFEVKCFSDAPPAVVSIFDGREASVTLSEVAHTPRASALWSNDACFVALAQNYFETKWNSSTEFDRAFSTS
jgi:sugar-specific transcriptional regulator TrmB